MLFSVRYVVHLRSLICVFVFHVVFCNINRYLVIRKVSVLQVRLCYTYATFSVVDFEHTVNIISMLLLPCYVLFRMFVYLH